MALDTCRKVRFFGFDRGLCTTISTKIIRQEGEKWYEELREQRVKDTHWHAFSIKKRKKEKQLLIWVNSHNTVIACAL